MEGLEHLEIGGKPSRLSRRGFSRTLGAMVKTRVDGVCHAFTTLSDFAVSAEIEELAGLLAAPDRRRRLGENVREFYRTR